MAEIRESNTFEYLSVISAKLEERETVFLKGLKKRLLEIINYGQILVFSTIDVNKVAEYIGAAFNAPDYQTNKTRDRNRVHARKALATALRCNTKYSLEFIGSSYLGGKDHATILHYHKSTGDLIDTKDKDFTPIFNSIIEKFNLKYYKYNS